YSRPGTPVHAQRHSMPTRPGCVGWGWRCAATRRRAPTTPRWSSWRAANLAAAPIVCTRPAASLENKAAGITLTATCAECLTAQAGGVRPCSTLDCPGRRCGRRTQTALLLVAFFRDELACDLQPVLCNRPGSQFLVKLGRGWPFLNEQFQHLRIVFA